MPFHLQRPSLRWLAINILVTCGSGCQNDEDTQNNYETHDDDDGDNTLRLVGCIKIKPISVMGSMLVLNAHQLNGTFISGHLCKTFNKTDNSSQTSLPSNLAYLVIIIPLDSLAPKMVV